MVRAGRRLAARVLRGGDTLPRLLAANSRAAELQPALRGDLAASFGRAKHCILLFLYGSPSQLETFDPHPNSAIAGGTRAIGALR